MRKLLIIGAGNLGRETFEWAKDIQEIEKRWDTIGFLDDDIHKLDKYHLSSMLIGTIKDHIPDPDCEYICSVQRPEIKMPICRLFKQKGAKFTNIIHPTVIIADYTTIGEGVILTPQVIVCPNATIGDHVLIDSFSIVGHDSTVEQGCTISDQCDLMGAVYLEQEVFMGSGSRILPQLRIGKNAKIGTGSVVIRNVPANISVFGNPAKRVE